MVDYRNNVIYNWGFKTAYGGGRYGEINMVGNYYKPGPASEHHRLLDVAEDGTGRYYLMGNVMEGNEEVTRNNHQAVGVRPDAQKCLVATPFSYEPIREDTPEEAYRKVLKQVGCSFMRDSYDRDVLRQVRKGWARQDINGIINSQDEVGGWPLLKRGKALKDSDGDGIPDIWERAHGLNPDDPTDVSTYTLSEEYTNIEIYLNGLVRLSK